MTPEDQAAHYRTAYDILKMMTLITVLVLIFVIFGLSLLVINSNTTIELNTIRYHEMQKSYDEQAIYFNNMKARIQAMNRKKDDE